MSSRAGKLTGVLLALTLLVGGGCGGGANKSDGGGANENDTSTTGGRRTQTFPEALAGVVDILLVVDNQVSMAPVHALLRTAFAGFENALGNLPGGIPDLHIGVISGDLGAAAFTDIPMCRPGGDRGILQVPAAGTACPGPQGRFVTKSAANSNYTGSLSDVLGCMTQLGAKGCGFNHPLAAAVAALGPNAPVENSGFLRPEAVLAVVVISNRDDCSAPPNAELFDPASRSITDRWGPLHPFRCSEFGHLCSGAPPPRASTELINCAPNNAGPLLPVPDLVSQMKALKSDPMKVLAFGLSGPPSPYRIRTLESGETELLASCTNLNLVVGYPAVRTQAWIDAFGGNGSFLPVCGVSLEPAITKFAMDVSRVLSPACVAGRVSDKNVTTIELEPDCLVKQKVRDAQGKLIETPIPACVDNGLTPPCWELVPNPACPRPTDRQLSIRRGDAAPVPDRVTEVSCVICDPNEPVLPLGCVR